jgi:nitrogen fixation/metabolism regulation signal transduction histidine kinase
MTDRLSPQRETEIGQRAKSRAEALTAWLDKFSPLVEGQREVEDAETVLSEDVPALLAELAAVRATLREACDQIAERDASHAELVEQQAEAVRVSAALSRRLSQEQLAGSALYAALTMPTTPQQRQDALDKFKAVAQQTFSEGASS